MSKKQKKKKEKVIYYDDNSTIADMSNVTRIGQKKPNSPQKQPQRRSTAKEKWRTYWSTVKMMLMPMCVVLLIIAALYLMISLLF